MCQGRADGLPAVERFGSIDLAPSIEAAPDRAALTDARLSLTGFNFNMVIVKVESRQRRLGDFATATLFVPDTDARHCLPRQRELKNISLHDTAAGIVC
jgi:hypothetical protein